LTIGWFWQAVLMTWLPRDGGTHMSNSLLSLFLLSTLLSLSPAAPHAGADRASTAGELEGCSADRWERLLPAGKAPWTCLLPQGAPSSGTSCR
jgi:hypothetical protein